MKKLLDELTYGAECVIRGTGIFFTRPRLWPYAVPPLLCVLLLYALIFCAVLLWIVPGLHAWAQGISFAGIDEAGRGPLAGPVAAACVVMPPEPLLLYVDDKPVAMALGNEISPLCFDINFEKALTEYDGSYSVINNEFAKRLTNYTYINREEDMGIEGLKKAKLSYHPAIIYDRYDGVPQW